MVAILALVAKGGDAPLTFATASKMSPAALERQVFQAQRGTTNEVHVYSLAHSLYWAKQRAEFGIDFADTPKATALSGLCSVQVRTAIFGQGYEPNAGRSAPTHLIELKEETRYAIQVSQFEPSTIAASAACVAGPVLENSRYFEVTDAYGRSPAPNNVVASIQALSRLMRDARQKRLAPVACTEDVFATYGGVWAPLCSDTAQSIAKLRWDELQGLSIRQCNGMHACMDATFKRPVAPREPQRIVSLNIEMERDARGSDLVSASLLGGTLVD